MWVPLMMMGVAALMNLLKEGRAPTGDARPRVDPDFKPVLTVTALVAAFVALGVLLTVLSAVASLGGGGVMIVICGFPIGIISLIAWLVNSNRPGARQAGKQARQETDPWTIDGAATEVKQDTRAETREARRAARAEPRGWVPPVAPPEPAAAPKKAAPAPKAQARPAPERPAVTPAEYRQRAASYRRKIHRTRASEWWDLRPTGRTLSGCGGRPEDLLAGAWQVTQIGARAIPAEVELSIVFDVAEGRVYGKSACNRYNATFTLTGEGLSFGPAAATMMACPDELMALEQEFQSLLATVSGFDVSEAGTLDLRSGDSSVMLAARP